ncbi:hypothetical protein Q5P01_006512 [Channa striata]|uniref:Uncharacterized protein n=1 Tax=Channa striata TaxID=64152 RepID=A0AA88N854_CHASR|nr:hypothetical protein Q5P01_006512 [Channa striata]
MDQHLPITPLELACPRRLDRNELCPEGQRKVCLVKDSLFSSSWSFAGNLLSERQGGGKQPENSQTWVLAQVKAPLELISPSALQAAVLCPGIKPARSAPLGLAQQLRGGRANRLLEQQREPDN